MDDLGDMPEFCRKEGGDLDDLGDMPEFCRKKNVTCMTIGTSHFLAKCMKASLIPTLRRHKTGNSKNKQST